jgi:hypothetical protein
MLRLAQHDRKRVAQYGMDFNCHPEPFDCHRLQNCHPEQREGSRPFQLNFAKRSQGRLREGSLPNDALPKSPFSAISLTCRGIPVINGCFQLVASR